MLDKDLYNAIEKLIYFSSNNNLTNKIAKIENDLNHHKSSFIADYLSENQLDQGILESAIIVKKSISQIDVIIHALGIANLLKDILDDDEVVQELSIGAGNTNRPFDLVTNKRIAEFKFINWTGKQDTIRQNSVFKDFFELESYDTNKLKYLYVFDKDIVLKFFNNNRALKSVLSKNETTRNNFYNKYGNKYRTVSEYYKDTHQRVKIVEIPQFTGDISITNNSNSIDDLSINTNKSLVLQKDVISNYIINLKNEAKIKGLPYIDIKAGDIGKATGFKKSFPNICKIMKQLKEEKDIVLYDTPSGMGSRVTIRYFLD